VLPSCRPLAVALLLPTLAQARAELAPAGPIPPAVTTAPAPVAPPPGAPGSAPALPAPQAGPTWRLSVGTGAATTIEILDFYRDLGLAFAGVASTRTGRTEVIVRADREQRRFRVGASYAFTRWDTRLSDGGGPRGSTRDEVHAVLVHGQFRWIDQEHVELYSGVGAGVARWASSTVLDGNRDHFSGVYGAWQLHLIGLGVGTPSFRAFAELGFGFEGVVLAGLAARF